ncbi:nitrate- and nitrite sensing domain-containing protein [Pseudomonas saliphila]|uniref:nitrate- and nitrite sensing domain-containing protein n=1 Tax=Pseudomonas saliphila TaxID=2586906 RepID=UPI00123852C0|nr:nitrate- and nitrite sensing domain-containing protein [Pseudomonas saliphila]
MYLGTVALFLLILIAVSLWFAQMRRKRLHARCEACVQELERITCLRHLLELVQQHRGLSFGEMGGEGSLPARRWAVHQEIRAQLARCRVHESSLQWYPGWHQALAQWAQIDSEQDDVNAESVLRSHNRMLALLLETIHSIADRHDLECLGSLATQPVGCWLQLLEHTELLGQARAIGTGILVRPDLSDALRAELERLRTRIAAQTYLPLAQLHADPQMRRIMAAEVQEAEDCLDRLLELIDRVLAVEAHPTLRSSTYFQTATHAITAHLVLVDQLLGRLKQDSRYAERTPGKPESP